MWRFIVLFFAASPALPHPTPWVTAVFEDGRVVAEAGNTSVHTPFAIASAGKLFTSIAFMRLVDRGVIDACDLANDWVPPRVARGLGGLSGVRLDHLATMTAGLPEYYTDEFVARIQGLPLADQTTAFALSFAYGQGIEVPPGTDFDYSNTNFLVLPLAMQQATGKPMTRSSVMR